MANTIGIDRELLKDDIKELNSHLSSSRNSTKRIESAIAAMERGLDSTRLQNVRVKINSLLNIQHTLENYYEWAIRVAEECYNKYQDVDTVLAKYANDMYDDKGGLLPPGEVDSDSQETKKDALLEVYQDGTGIYQRVPNCMEYAMKQTDYALPNKGSNGGCTATAWAMCRSMIDKTRHNPEAFWGSGGCNWAGNSKQVTGEAQMLQTAYSQLQQGKPSVFYGNYTYTSYGQDHNSPHAVTIVGVREGVDPNNLTLNDFLVIDAYNGQLRNLGDMRFYATNKLVIY